MSAIILTGIVVMPAWTPANTAAFLFQIIFGLVLGFVEGRGIFHLPYSKFRGQATFSARTGMLIIYSVPILVYWAGYSANGSPDSLYHQILLVTFVIMFLKRCLEVVFLHRYSGGMGLLAVVLITFLYSAVAQVATYMNNGFAPAAWGSLEKATMNIGIPIFFAGLIINFIHHVILARMRKRGPDGAVIREYKIPTSGLFRFVACPHYLGEIIAWLGYALMSRHLAVYGVVFIMICYLSGRAYRTNAWYREKFPDYPADRKALVPFVF